MPTFFRDMNIVAILLLVTLFTTKVRPSRSLILSILNKRRAPIPLSEELGTSPSLSYKYFDPFNFASEENFSILREAELKHGRIAMLAVLGNIVPDLFREQLVPPIPIFLSFSNELFFQDIPCGIDAIRYVPTVGWLQMIAFCGFLERRVFVQKDRRSMPGDYGTGYFGVRDKGANERSLKAELENGRLAMIAFLGQIVAEIVTGDTVLIQIQKTLFPIPVTYIDQNLQNI
jgi:hypothetical protein